MKNYYHLAKPGLVYGNLIPLIGAFFLASRGNIDWTLFFAAVIGLALVMASGCVFNNYFDRDIDAVMGRTRERALVTGRISGRAALLYAWSLGVAGFLILLIFTDLLAFFAALVGFIFYVGFYTLWSKRRSAWGTVVGTVAGAMPPVVGYMAVTDRFDGGAVLLFLILVFWQLAHFFAIGLHRRDDYVAAGIPILPVRQNANITKSVMVASIIAFVAVSVLLGLLEFASSFYTIAAAVFGAAWLLFGVFGFWSKHNTVWSRRMFMVSLVVLVLLFAAMVV
ncbi:MAG: heme o synthase [Patescibacteria group bacterium]|nr:heme o synthase [Patescibacteria group bacterium]